MSDALVWTIAALTLGGILLRPRHTPEWCWAVGGAALLVCSGLLPLPIAAHSALDGLDVYLFLAGMLALAELARVEGLFDWIAARVVPAANGSQPRLFGWTYVAGAIVTAFLSNDATIVLLTPAVLAAVRAADADPMPYAYACAFVANAASFLLPISNPANLVVFRELPPLIPWLRIFALACVVATAATYVALRAMYRRALRTACATQTRKPALKPSGKIAAAAIALSACCILAASALGWRVGEWTFFVALAAMAAVALVDRSSVTGALRRVQWSIIPLVAGLFAIVAALDRTGAVGAARRFFEYAATFPPFTGSLLSGAAVTLAANALNNLPTGVIVRYAFGGAIAPPYIAHAALVGVDLGPNFSVTGSLATILWLMTLRRAGIRVTPWSFLGIGSIVTLPALLLALAAIR